jgi:hypothetical protein
MNSHCTFRSFAYLSSFVALTSCGSTETPDEMNVAPSGGTTNSTSALQSSGAASQHSTGSQTASAVPTTTGPTGSTAGTVATSSGGSGTTSTSGAATSGPSGASGTTGSTTSTSTGAQTSTGPSGSNSSTGEMSTGPDTDEGGKTNAMPGTRTDEPQDYIRLGELRILNNNWGSEDLNCFAPTSTMSVFVNDDGRFGWDFNRGDCAGPTDTSHPDFPQLEFGVHPFGLQSHLATSPGFSSTTLLPKQIKDITSASVTLDDFNISLGGQDSWNIAMEFWLSERHPIDDPNPGVYAELMAWWGWDQGRWPCDDNDMNGQNDFTDSVQAGNKSYRLCHQNDQWADGWRYYQFRAGDGTDSNISTNFSGTIDVKAFLNYLVTSRNYSPDLWVTRIEVGSEIDDLTNGTVSMKGAKFEINGEERSQVMGTP